MEFLKHRCWAGNIRELENLVERLVVLAPHDSKFIGIEALPNEYTEELQQVRNGNYSTHSTQSLNKRLHDFESQIIREALINHDWNQTRAAHSLNIPEQTLRYRMHKLKICRN